MMKKILLRAGKSPFQVVDQVTSLEDYPAGIFAMNVGNLIYSDAMHRILSTPSTEIVPNAFLGERIGVTRGYLDRLNREFDHFVIPLANAFRPSFIDTLDRLSRTIEALTIPVTVVGVGVAGGPGSLTRKVDDVPASLKRAVRRFVDAVLQRSATIGVRGGATRTFLRSLGYGDDVIDVIGCPSLFRNGADLRVGKRRLRIEEDSTLALNISPYVAAMGPLSLRHAARYPKLIYIPQDIDTMRLMMWGENRPGFSQDMPTHVGHPLYRDGRMRFFVDSRTWIDHLKTVDFSFGTRIHGNIAALVAGTPAMVLVHDTKTMELAEFHDIPHRLVDDLAFDTDAAELYEQADFSAFNAGHAARQQDFEAFLNKNGVPNIFAPGQGNPAYDAALAALTLPGPLVPLSVADDQMRARVAWLRARLSTRPNAALRHNRFAAPFPHQRPAGVAEAARLLLDRGSNALRKRLR